MSSTNETTQLAAAVVLRRFYDTETDVEKFREETTRVIASLLKILKKGVYQKTLGDGFAFAGHLNYADLQRTNLQDLYLGVKNKNDDEQEKKEAEAKRVLKESQKMNQGQQSQDNNGLLTSSDPSQSSDDESKMCPIDVPWTLKMDYTDMFEADLSDALLENIQGFGTVFYCAKMRSTRIKNCVFINADFREVDFENAKFENVILTGSKFKGARHLPEEIKQHLNDKGEYQDYCENDTVRDPKKRALTTKKKPIVKNVFFSLPGSIAEPDKTIPFNYEKLMRDLGYTPVIFKRNQYTDDSQISIIREIINDSVGMIAFGLKQTLIKNGVARPSLSDELDVSGTWLPTPWNEIEVGMAMMSGLPVLLVKDDDISEGVFDTTIKESHMKSIPATISIDEIKNEEAFKQWLQLMG